MAFLFTSALTGFFSREYSIVKVVPVDNPILSPIDTDILGVSSF